MIVGKDYSELNQDAIPVSICIPTYNGATYLTEAIISVLQQTFSNFELLIVDDSSTDETVSIIQAFQDPRLKFYRNANRLGLVGNWNRCLELAQGEYICIFHQDDIMMPNNIVKKLEMLNKNPNVGMVYSNVYLIDPQGNIRSNQWYFKSKPEKIWIHQGITFFQQLFVEANIVCCPTVVIRKTAYEKLGGFDSSLPFSPDWEMWLRIALFYDVGYLVEPLVKYRRHAEMETLNFSGVKGLEQAYRAKMRIIQKYPQLIPDVENLRKSLIEYYQEEAITGAIRFHQRGQIDQAKQYLSLAVQLHRRLIPADATDEYAVWFLRIIDRLWYQDEVSVSVKKSVRFDEERMKLHPEYWQLLDNLCGQDIGLHIPLSRLIKGIGFKLTMYPSLRWLYHYRDKVKQLLDAI